MADNSRVRVLDCLKNAVGLFFLGHLEAAMNARDHKIERAEYAVRII